MVFQGSVVSCLCASQQIEVGEGKGWVIVVGRVNLCVILKITVSIKKWRGRARRREIQAEKGARERKPLLAVYLFV